MPKRKYKTDPAALLAEGQLIVKSGDDARFQHRVEMVNLVLAGLTPSFLAERVADSKNAITLWVKTADERGFDALRDKKQTGRPTKLTAEQIEEIREVVAEDDPKSRGFNVWDGPSVSAYIGREYGVSLGVRQCQRMLRSLGFSLAGPQTYPSKGRPDDGAREAYKKTR